MEIDGLGSIAPIPFKAENRILSIKYKNQCFNTVWPYKSDIIWQTYLKDKYTKYVK